VTAISGVIFDLGGVVFESPIRRIADFEQSAGLPPQTVARVIRSNGENGAWHQLERGEIDRSSFIEAFGAEFRDVGVPVDVRLLLGEIESALVVRPSMLDAIDSIRRSGVTVAALTNNWSPMSGLPVAQHFDVFVESFVEGCRKPDPEIYLRTLERMGSEPAHTAMLDDLGENLKTARSLGMITHKVDDPDEAVRWLFTQLESAVSGGHA
jgi:epoxide hydrolase-like predicted phosphatase